jgi:chromosome segregation ATPase
MIFSIPILWLASIAAGASPFAQMQVTTPDPTAKEAKLPAKRVWTNDDLPVLRKPWDNYLEQKAAEQAARAAAEKAEAEKRAKAAKDARATGSAAEADLAPHSVEEAEARIRQKKEEIGFQKELISRTRDAYGLATEENIRQSLIKKLDMLDTDLDAAYAELKTLESQLEELKRQGPQKGGAGTVSGT